MGTLPEATDNSSLRLEIQRKKEQLTSRKISRRDDYV